MNATGGIDQSVTGCRLPTAAFVQRDERALERFRWL